MKHFFLWNRGRTKKWMEARKEEEEGDGGGGGRWRKKNGKRGELVPRVYLTYGELKGRKKKTGGSQSEWIYRTHLASSHGFRENKKSDWRIKRKERWKEKIKKAGNGFYRWSRTMYIEIGLKFRRETKTYESKSFPLSLSLLAVSDISIGGGIENREKDGDGGEREE